MTRGAVLPIRATVYLNKIETQPFIEKCNSYLSIECDNFIAQQGVTSILVFNVSSVYPNCLLLNFLLRLNIKNKPA